MTNKPVILPKNGKLTAHPRYLSRVVVTVNTYDTVSPYVDTVTGPAVDATYKVAYRGTKENDLGPMSPEMMIAAGG